MSAAAVRTLSLPTMAFIRATRAAWEVDEEEGAVRVLMALV